MRVRWLFKSNPLPYDKILDWSKLKQSADDNFEFDVPSRKSSELVENTVGKGEIARNEQFLLFLQCFQKTCFPGASKGVIVWEWVKYLGLQKLFSTLRRHKQLLEVWSKSWITSRPLSYIMKVRNNFSF